MRKLEPGGKKCAKKLQNLTNAAVFVILGGGSQYNTEYDTACHTIWAGGQYHTACDTACHAILDGRLIQHWMRHRMSYNTWRGLVQHRAVSHLVLY